MDLEKVLATLEAILFASGEPIECEKIATALGLEESQVTNYIIQLNQKLEDDSRAVEIKRLGDSFQMVSKKEFADAIRAVLEVKKNTPLSPAAMECLAIIAYNQPVTKGFIENIRGVDSSQTVNNLVAKGLVQEAGRLDVPGRPIAYRTTKNFLRCFGIDSLEHLPALPEPDERQLTIDDMAEKTTETDE